MKNLFRWVTVLCVVSAIIAIGSIIFAVSTLDIEERHEALQDMRRGFRSSIYQIVEQPDGTLLVVNVLPTKAGVELPMSGITDGSTQNPNPNPNPNPGPSPNITPADEDVVINDWLVLHAKPSGSASIDNSGTKVGIYKSNKWSMGIGNSLIKANSYMVNLYSDRTTVRPTINGKTATEGSVNSSGRYWVGIGPSWFQPGKLDSNGYPSGDTFKYASNFFPDGTGHNFDVVVNYQGKTYYIYCCAGDIKAHTYGDGKGYVQSSYNRSGTPSPGNRDFSCVEFIGVTGSVGAGLSSKMTFQGIMKY